MVLRDPQPPRVAALGGVKNGRGAAGIRGPRGISLDRTHYCPSPSTVGAGGRARVTGWAAEKVWKLVGVMDLIHDE